MSGQLRHFRHDDKPNVAAVVDLIALETGFCIRIEVADRESGDNGDVGVPSRLGTMD